MMHVRLRTSAGWLREAALDLAEETGTWTFAESVPTDSPSWRLVELTVGEATMGFAGGEVGQLFDRLLVGAAAASVR